MRYKSSNSVGGFSEEHVGPDLYGAEPDEDQLVLESMKRARLQHITSNQANKVCPAVGFASTTTALSRRRVTSLEAGLWVAIPLWQSDSAGTKRQRLLWRLTWAYESCFNVTRPTCRNHIAAAVAPQMAMIWKRHWPLR